MDPRTKRFVKQYRPIYDTIAKLDVDQELREEIVGSLADAIKAERQPDFKDSLFRRLASDPLSLCAGPAEGVPCPNGTWIRTHATKTWADGTTETIERKPEVRCISCGATMFIPQYAENSESASAVAAREGA